jgi:hypothetical protein
VSCVSLRSSSLRLSCQARRSRLQFALRRPRVGAPADCMRPPPPYAILNLAKKMLKKNQYAIWIFGFCAFWMSLRFFLQMIVQELMT